MAENELLTPAEVAVMFRVNPKTVTRWARAGKISAVRTLVAAPPMASRLISLRAGRLVSGW